MKASLFVSLAALLLALPVPRALCAPQNVTIANDMNSGGRKIAHPTPEHPAYYVGVFRGYLDRGKQWGNGDPQGKLIPTPDTVKELVTKTLAEQGYLPALKDLTTDPQAVSNAPTRQVLVGAPSLFLMVQWGYMSNTTLKIPVSFDFAVNRGGGPMAEHHEIDSNPPPNPEQIELVGGSQKNLGPGSFLDAALSRYYIIVDAFDYAAYRQNKKLVLLWKTRLSMPANLSNSMAGTLPALLAAGGPAFGRDARLPLNVGVDVLPSGKVIIGKAVVIEPPK